MLIDYLSGVVHTRETKAHRFGLRIYRVQKLCIVSSVRQTFQNNLGLSLYTTLSVCYLIITSEEELKSKRELSADSDVLPLNTRN